MKDDRYFINRDAFEHWLSNNPESRFWNTTDAMFSAFLGGLSQQASTQEVARNNPVSALAIRILVGSGRITQAEADNAFTLACQAMEEEAQRMNVELPWVVRTGRPGPSVPEPLTVRIVTFPESNGKRNWTAMFMRTKHWNGLIGNAGGVTIAHGECWNRVAYSAERARCLLGERVSEPSILAYAQDVSTPEEWKGHDPDSLTAAEVKRGL